MISVVICARSPALSIDFEHHIRDTIGVPYELIFVDNSANKYSIFEAYNLGVQQSKFAYICFMHDDIYYHTRDWGKRVTAHFGDEKTGAIGIAGTPYMPMMPGAWWDGGMVNIHIIPWNAVNNQPTLMAYPGAAGNKKRVAVVDGVWFCIKRDLFDQLKFDEITYKGFHYYDMDISLQVHRAGYHIYSVFDILIAHFSKGDMNKNWCDNALIFKNKWENILPVIVGHVPYSTQCEAELKTLTEFILIRHQNGVPTKLIYRLAFKHLLKLSWRHFYYKYPLRLSKYLFKSII